MIKLGITGGIGCGKSTVVSILKLLGIPVYIADTESKKLTDSSPTIRRQLVEIFGSSLYINDKLNKSLLASYIFADKDKLELVNSIIHPEVEKHFSGWVQQHKDCKIIAKEAAIMFESGMDKLMDKVIVVYTPLEMRIQRTMARSFMTREEVLERINSQMSDEKKRELADYIIINDESESLIEQTLSLVNKLGYTT